MRPGGRIAAGVAAAVVVAGGIVAWAGAARSAPPKRTPAPAKAAQIKIDLDRAVAVALPAQTKALEPASFTTPDGKTGWAIEIPGGRPIATPAYANGRLFVGGGYGSHEFYAFDADTGKMAWQIKTSDDGPTAAVVEDGCVAFNTESCTVFVIDASTGKELWHEWLGDPLMSQPAISRGRLYMAHPASGRGGQNMSGGAPAGMQQKDIKEGAPQSQTSATPTRSAMSHAMLCADLRTGRHIWSTPIPAEVITAPVVEGDKLYFTCMEGSSYCLNALEGNVIWQKKVAATSAPLVLGKDVIVTQKAAKPGGAAEGIRRFEASKGGEKDRQMIASGKADYLSAQGGGGVAISKQHMAELDSSVGFGAGAPGAANMGAAQGHLGVSSVAGAWAYQGSRAAYGNGQLMNAQGRAINSVDAKSGRVLWRAETLNGGMAASAQAFSPPALGARKMYLASAQGHLLALDQKAGKVAFLYALKQPIAFQPALAHGNVYAGTNNGRLICLKTGDRDADGWFAWGGNAQHNKK